MVLLINYAFMLDFFTVMNNTNTKNIPLYFMRYAQANDLHKQTKTLPESLVKSLKVNYTTNHIKNQRVLGQLNAQVRRYIVQS